MLLVGIAELEPVGTDGADGAYTHTLHARPTRTPYTHPAQFQEHPRKSTLSSLHSSVLVISISCLPGSQSFPPVVLKTFSFPSLFTLPAQPRHPGQQHTQSGNQPTTPTRIVDTPGKQAGVPAKPCSSIMSKMGYPGFGSGSGRNVDMSKYISEK